MRWRAIPKNLPPRSTLHGYFDLWSWDGTLDRIHHALYVECRQRAEREASPTAAIIDSQSVQSAEKWGLTPRLYPFLLKLYANGGYQGAGFQDALRSILRCVNIEIVKRSDQARRFVVLPKRWIVERTFAWLGRCRRLAKDW